jgi:hypothetical protein
MTIDHTEFRELSTKAASRFLDIFESALLYVHVNHQFGMCESSKTPCSLKKDETDEWDTSWAYSHAAYLAQI